MARSISMLALLLFAGNATAHGDRISQASAAPPNVILLLADDLGYGELQHPGSSGGTSTPVPETADANISRIPTPHIDRLAQNGIRFTCGYVTASYCSASRAGLLTGRYQSRFGYDDNPTGARNELPNAGLPIAEQTFVSRLQDHGYATGLVGKWHLGGTAKFHPQRRGFDEFFGFTHEGHFYLPPPYKGATTMLRRKSLPPGASGQRWVSNDKRLILSSHMGHHEPDYDANNPIVRQSQPIHEPAFLTDAFTREAIDFIERHRERPFFLYVAYNAVHSPLQASDRYMNRFSDIDDVQRRIFAAMLAHLDDSVGAILSKLENTDLLENTLIIFLSDNGGPTKELTSSNQPLRGGKGQLYEGGIRVPFMMHWPSMLPSSKTYTQPVISLDLAATILSATGASPAALRENRPDGVNLIPFLTEDQKAESPEIERRKLEPREFFWRMGNRAAIRSGDWKAVRHPRTPRNQRDDTLAVESWELFHLGNDIGESHELSATHADRKLQLIRRWNELNQDMIPPVRWQ